MSSREPWKQKWVVESQLGAGGQGTVFLVHSLSDPATRSVLKKLKNQRSPTARGRMRREVASLETLAAEGLKVPRVLDGNTDQFEAPDVPLYFVMDHIPGDTLSRVIDSRGRLPLDKAAAFVFDLARTISAAHGEGVLHRDLKPDNIIVRDFDADDLVIVDYGLSFNEEDEDDGLTETGDQLRNRFLSLPETNTPGGNRRDPRTDITVLCAMLYYFLTGHSPGQLRDSGDRPPHRSEGHTLRDALAGDSRREQIDLLLDRGLAPAIESRFQAWDEFTDRLTLAISPTASELRNPVEVARRLSKHLLQNNSKIMIEGYRGNCETALSGLTKHLEPIRRESGFFQVEYIGTGETGPDSLSGPFDPITRTHSIRVGLHPHEHVCTLYYLIASSGLQFVLLHALHMHRQTKPKPTLDWGTDWEPRVWFDPTKGATLSVFSAHIDSDLAAAFERLADLASGDAASGG